MGRIKHKNQNNISTFITSYKWVWGNMLSIWTTHKMVRVSFQSNKGRKKIEVRTLRNTCICSDQFTTKI